MISKISPTNNNKNITFSAVRPNKIAMLERESLRRASSLRDACKEILGKINLNEAILDKAPEMFKKVKLTKKVIVFTLSDIDSIRLAMPRGPQGNLFTMQILKNKKPENTVTINNNGCLIESYCLNNEHFVPQEDYNKNLVDKVVTEIFDSVDYPLLQLRMNLNKVLSDAPLSYTSNGAILKQSKPETVKSEAPKSETKKPFIPPSGHWEEYSMVEVLKQNAGLIPTEKRRVWNKHDMQKRRLEKASSYALEVANRPKVVIKSVEENKAMGVINPVIEEPTKPNELQIQSVKRRRGRPPKIRSMEQLEQSRTYKIVKTKVKSSKPKMDVCQDISTGVINSATISKLNEIRSLYQEIRASMQTKSACTVSKIISSYENIKKFGAKSITFGDVRIMFPHTKNINEEIFNITDLRNMQSVNISASGKMFAGEGEWFNMMMKKNESRLLSQDEIDKRIADGGVDKKLDLAINELKTFKEYLDKEGWRVVKSRKFQEGNDSRINKELNERLQVVKGLYDKIQETCNSMSQRKRVDIKRDYSNLKIAKKSSRLEFIIPKKDGATILFDYSDNRFGGFYKLAKLSPENKFDELFLISTEGQVLKNAVKDKGFFPTSSGIFYTREELKENDVNKRVSDLLSFLEQNMTNYRDYLVEEKSKLLIKGMTGKANRTKAKPQKDSTSKPLVEKIAETVIKPNIEKNEISFDTVKEFLEKVTGDLQTSADKLREVTGFRSMIDSIVESLKTKFDDFLKQHKN